MIETCLKIWNRSKQAYEDLRNEGLIALPSGRTLCRKKNILAQKPGLNLEVLDEMLRQAKTRELSPPGFHGFIVFDEMTIQVNKFEQDLLAR